jgi:hypothetical protein
VSIEEIKNAINTKSKKNVFRACLHNKLDPAIGKREKQYFKEFVPTEIQGFPVDLYKWTQAEK